MKLWIDTEFNGFDGELLSMALVGEDGSAFYAVMEYHIGDICEWVRENVVPYLHIGPDSEKYEHVYHCIDKITFQQKLSNFLCQFNELTIIGDWPEDLKHLMDIMITGPGWMISTPTVMKFTVDRSLDTESFIPHNAYYDALANMEASTYYFV